MKDSPPHICLLFRNSKFFSIEHLFESLRSELQQIHVCDYIKVPQSGASPLALLKNLFWGLKLRNADVVHITGDVNYMALALRGRQTILTIHDVIHLEENRQYSSFKSWLIRKLWYDYPLRKARFITCISNATKEALLKHFPQCQADKIVVIPNPTDLRFTPTNHEFHCNCPRLLFMGTKVNKNLPRVITAIKGLDVELRIIGILSENYIQQLETAGIKWSTAHNLSDAEIREEYAHCDLLCFPSIAEGFGLPILEAQASGKAVLTSNCSSMPEVAGPDGALFVDPLNVESIREGIVLLCKDEDFRNRLIKNGLCNIKRFLPANIATQYSILYDRILHEKKHA